MPSVRFKFDSHGLGDVVHFVHAVQLYLRRGYDVEVQTEQNKRFLWEVSGVKMSDEQLAHHSYLYPHGFDDLTARDCDKNKVAWGMTHHTLPPLEALGLTAQALWDELCLVRINAMPFVSEKAHMEADAFLAGMPRPVIVLHSRGTNWHQRKSIPTETAFELVLRLLDVTQGSVIVLDYDARAPMVGHERCKGIRPSWGRIDTDRLCALYSRTDVMIGVDSGPFHVASMVPGLKALGVFRSLHPNRVCLPNPNAVYMVNKLHHAHWEQRLDRWNLAEYDGPEPTVDDIATAAMQMLSGSKVAIAAIPIDPKETRRYLYRRVGHDERLMTMLPNGAIGEGAGDCERQWKAVEGGIQIIGDHGIIAALEMDDRGIFVGRWTKFERMPVEIVPVEGGV